MASRGKCLTITWRIENYNFSRGIPLSSPLFVIDETGGVTWILRVVHCGLIQKKHIYFSAKRKTNDKSKDIRINFEIFFFNDNSSSPLFEDTYTNCDGAYISCYVPHNQIYSSKGNELYSPETLTIRCRMSLRNDAFSDARQFFARTRIRTEKTAFVATAEKFSCLMPEEKRFLTIKSHSTEKQLLTLKIYLDGGLCCKDKLCIEVIPTMKDYIKCCVSKMFVFNSEGIKIECGRNEFFSDEQKVQDWKFPLFFTKGYLLERNMQFLRNDTLTLKCEFAFSTGIEYERIEDSDFDNHSSVSESQSEFSSALEDLTCLYKEGILCDMKLRTETETFNVHKNILSARSSVFKSMFTTNMRESITDCVVIEDLEADTVRRMLLFLYSDNLEDLNSECAKKLYFAADKYNIPALKYRCSEYLKTNLQPSDCCNLLLLSDRHQDEGLKKAVLEYMAEHHEKILQTDQWMNLMKSNPVLTAETLQTLYLRNWKKIPALV